MARGDDGLIISFDSRHMEVMAGESDILQLHVDKFRLTAQLHPYQHQLAAVELTPVTRPVMRHSHINLIGSEILRVDKEVSPHLLQNPAILWLQKLRIVDTRHSLLCPQSLGDRAGCDVAGLKRGDGNIQVALIYTHLAQCVERRRAPVVGHQIIIIVDGVQFRLVVVEQNYILILVGEHLGEMSADFAGSGDDDFHLLSLRLFPEAFSHGTLDRVGIYAGQCAQLRHTPLSNPLVGYAESDVRRNVGLLMPRVPLIEPLRDS